MLHSGFRTASETSSPAETLARSYADHLADADLARHVGPMEATLTAELGRGHLLGGAVATAAVMVALDWLYGALTRRD